MATDRDPPLDFADDLILAEAGFQGDAVRYRRQVEQAEAPGPLADRQLGRAAIGIAPRIGGIVERAEVDRRPVEEVVTRIVRVFVLVENVADAELADRDGEPIGGVRCAKDVEVGFNGAAVAAEVDRLAQEQPLQPEVRGLFPDLIPTIVKPDSRERFPRAG